MKRVLVVLIAVAGCKSVPSDWSDKKPVTQTVKQPELTYSIDIPDGLPKDDRNVGDWSDARVEYDKTPKVFTSVYPLEMPKTLDEASREASLHPDKANFVRKDQRPDGWAFTDAPADKHRIEVSVLKSMGGKIVKCTAVQVMEDELPSYDKTKAMLEAICDSLKAK